MKSISFLILSFIILSCSTQKKKGTTEKYYPGFEKYMLDIHTVNLKDHSGEAFYLLLPVACPCYFSTIDSLLNRNDNRLQIVLLGAPYNEKMVNKVALLKQEFTCLEDFEFKAQLYKINQIDALGIHIKNHECVLYHNYEDENIHEFLTYLRNQ